MRGENLTLIMIRSDLEIDPSKGLFKAHSVLDGLA